MIALLELTPTDCSKQMQQLPEGMVADGSMKGTGVTLHFIYIRVFCTFNIEVLEQGCQIGQHGANWATFGSR